MAPSSLPPPTHTDWADDVDDDLENEEEMESNSVTIDENGNKVIVQYYEEDGKKFKTTQVIRSKVVSSKVNKSIAHRKKLAKFGAALGAPAGPETSTTNVGEEVLLKLSSNIQVVEMEEVDTSKLKIPDNTKIICRYCKLNHWSINCPYKDSLQAVEEMEAKIDSPKEGKAELPSSGKYIPPSLRGLGDRKGETMNKRDDSATIRITNLSEDTREQDLQLLMRPFGPITRLFLAKDKDTGDCKGFAFVSFNLVSDAQKAVAALDGHGYANLILRVSMSKSEK